MNARMNIRSIILVMAIIGLASMFFINICFATGTGKITTETARLREQPNTDSKVLELASFGENVEIIEKLDGWYKVKYKKITGYIRNDLLEVENKVEENTIPENKVEENTTPENNELANKETLEKGKRELAYDVKLKIVPLISSIELGEVKKGTEVEITEILNNWAKIKTQDGKEGWVLRKWNSTEGEMAIVFYMPETKANNIQNPTEKEPEQNTTIIENQVNPTTKTMYVNSQTINLREGPNTTSKIIKQLYLNKEVTVISNENNWYKVEVDGKTGYISQNLLSDTKKETSRGGTTERPTTQIIDNTKTEENKQETTSNSTITVPDTKEPTTNGTSNSTQGNEIVAYAKQFLGNKYVYGGTTPSGFDCSGFTQYVYKHFGININRTAAAQYSNGTSVTDLQAGDLVMFGKSGINHVGIYIGGNTFIHAANSRRGVTTDTLASGYYKTNYVGARRIL